LLPGVLDEPVDYLAVGPVFTTTTKHTYKTPIGPEGVRRLRELAGPDRILTAAGRHHAGYRAGRAGSGRFGGRRIRGDFPRR